MSSTSSVASSNPRRGTEWAKALPSGLRDALCLQDFEAKAKAHLPRPLFQYVAGGVEDNFSRQVNRDAFQAWALLPRVLVNVSQRTLQTTLFGQTFNAPFGIAPMGLSALMAYDGDRVLARAAKQAGIPMILSGTALTKLEDIAQIAPEHAWFQAYVPGEESHIEGLIERVARAKFSTLVPVFSKDAVRKFGMKEHLSWRHLALIRRMWKGKLVVKGILSAQDARLAEEHGADGIVVSNHGGRQLAGAVAPLRVLPEIVASKGAMAVMIDSGFRRGTDVIKALCLGADFVFVGRPMLYAASIAGEQGVTHAIDLLREEVRCDMALLGVTSIAGLDRSCLITPV